jgi:hypothetical protein
MESSSLFIFVSHQALSNVLTLDEIMFRLSTSSFVTQKVISVSFVQIKNSQLVCDQTILAGVFK